MQPFFLFSEMLCLAAAGIGCGAASADDLFQTLGKGADVLDRYR
jgi:hypothetical protein